MSLEKSEALVIRMADFSESSRVVTFFTKEFGKISALAKGAKRLKGPFESALDLLATCRIVFIRKSAGKLDLLTEAELLHRFTPFSGSLNALYSGYYVAELLNELTEKYDTHDQLYSTTVKVLRKLCEVPSETQLNTQVIIPFELELLRELGQLPSFDLCENCGAQITSEQTELFWISSQGAVCATCRRYRAALIPISSNTLHVLQNLSACEPFVSGETKHSQILGDIPLQTQMQTHREIRRFLSETISHIMGKRPKMYRYLFS